MNTMQMAWDDYRANQAKHYKRFSHAAFAMCLRNAHTAVKVARHPKLFVFDGSRGTHWGG